MAMNVRNSGGGGTQTLNTLNKNNKSLSKSLGKIASGMKLASVADGASDYAISERMRTQIRSLNQATENTQNANALLKVAEGAIMSSLDILRVMKERAIDSANDTNTELDRQIMQKEIDHLVDQLDDNANVTYNGKYLLDGTKKFAGNGAKSVWINYDVYGATNNGGAGLLLARRNSTPSTGYSGAQSYPYRIVVPGDTIQVSYVQDAETITKSFQVITNSNPTWSNLVNETWRNSSPHNNSPTTGGYENYFGEYIKYPGDTPEKKCRGLSIFWSSIGIQRCRCKGCNNWSRYYSDWI